MVQLTDIHAGLYMTRTDIRRIAETASRLQPELLVLTGDFISNSMAYLSGCVEELAHIRAHLGTFATLGNHEHRFGDPEETRRFWHRATRWGDDYSTSLVTLSDIGLTAKGCSRQRRRSESRATPNR